jgi:hypothetical protein
MAGAKGGNAAQKVMVNRILAVDSLIREGGFPIAASIARKLEVTSRTIQRDIYSEINFWALALSNNLILGVVNVLTIPKFGIYYYHRLAGTR